MDQSSYRETARRSSWEHVGNGRALIYDNTQIPDSAFNTV